MAVVSPERTRSEIVVQLAEVADATDADDAAPGLVLLADDNTVVRADAYELTARERRVTQLVARLYFEHDGRVGLGP